MAQLEFTLIVLCVLNGLSRGVPIQRRLLFGLFGHTVQNPADMSHELGIHNYNVGDQTNSLAIQHQIMSAGANGTGYVQHQSHNGPAFLNQNGALGHQTDHLPGKCTSVPQHCPPECTAVDTVTGCIICKTNCHSGNTNVQRLSTSPPRGKTTTPIGGTGTHCPPFPGGCPRGSVSLVNGCPICTESITAYSSSTPLQTTTPPITMSSTCASLRCVAPCNKGLTFDSTGCPKCVC